MSATVASNSNTTTSFCSAILSSSSASSSCATASVSPTCTTMENSLRNVALLNTKGIHALVMGRKNYVPRALQAFKKALEDLEMVRSSDYQNTNCCCSSTSARQCAAGAAGAGGDEEHYLEAFNSSPVSRLDAQRDYDSFYVYNRAIFFKPLSDTSSIGLTFYSAILQFNMALAHHIKACLESTRTGGNNKKNKEDSNNSNKSLNRALKHYKMCLKTLKEVGVCGSMAGRPPYPGNGEAMIYLRLAALNNLAHIHTLGGDYEKVDDTLARVFKFTVAQRPTLFLAASQERHNHTASSSSEMDDCSTRSALVTNRRRRANNFLSSDFVNEVLLNVMVSGPVAGAGAA